MQPTKNIPSIIKEISADLSQELAALETDSELANQLTWDKRQKV